MRQGSKFRTRYSGAEPAIRNAWEWDVVAEPLVARRLTVATDGRRWICGILMHDESGTAILALVAITFC
jgi:hypothetical protein